MKRLILINVDLKGLKKGSKVSVDADDAGVVIDPYWRNRLKDAVIDNCCELVSEETVEEDKGEGQPQTTENA